jgi:thiol-disulfide isomerase/thioredoxin
LKKIILLILIGLLTIFVLTGCNGIVPSEGEGEGEGEPEPTKTTVLMEAFIAVGCSQCAKIEPIIENLAMEYSRDDMILVELVPWGTSYDLREARQRMTDLYGLETKIPQIAFNGLSNHIIGSTGVTYSYLKNIINAQLAKTPAIELTASKTNQNYTTVITGTVKNISSNTLSNLVVNGMIIKDMGQTGFHYTVTDIFEDEKEKISSIAPGEEKIFTITVTDSKWTTTSDGVIFVQSTSDPKKTIKQSIFLD